MATLINWLDDPLKKKLGTASQAQITSAPVKQNISVSSAGNMVAQSRPSTVNTPKVAPSFQLSSAPKAPLKTSTLSLNSLSQKTAPQLTLSGKNTSPNLSTVKKGNSNMLTTLSKSTFSPTLNLPTAQKQTVPKQPSNVDANLALERTNQAKERYNSLRDNNNEFWGKYQSALETTKDQYKDLFGKSTQQRSVNQLGAGLKKMATEQGSLPTSGEDFINKYRSLSNDDKWDVWQNLQKAKTTLTQAIGKADDEGQDDLKKAFGVLLSEVSVYDDMISGEDKGKKSFGKSFGDWMSSGGFVGGMAQPATNALGTLAEIMGNKGGAETSRAISDDNATANHGNHGLVGALDFAGSTIGNIAANMVTGGAYGLANAGLGLADSASSAVTDRNRNYYTDADGNLIRENQSTESKLAGIGNSALSAGLTVAGMKGIGPNIDFKNGQTLQSLIGNKNFSELGKALGKYAAKELPWALATTAASQGISALGGDKNFTDDFGAELANNIVCDLAVDLTGAARQGVNGNRDLFKPGNENDPSALQRLQQLGYKINNELNERGGIGLTIKDVNDAKGDMTLSSLLDELWGKTSSPETPTKPKQSYNEAESTQRLNNLAEGKLSYSDYSKYQSERLWEAFQNSNGGVETFLKGANQYNSDGSRADVSRHAISENGTLYRQLYDELGRKPSRKSFNSALEDVLTKGDQSKYYDSFKEFNPEIGLYNAGSDDIDMLISAREYAGSSKHQTPEQQNHPNLAQKAINKVDEVYTKAINTNAVNRLEKSLTEAMNGGTKGNTKFVRLTKETLNDINEVRQAQGMNPLTKRQVTAYEGALNGHLQKHIADGTYSSTREAAQAAFDVLTSADLKVIMADQTGKRSGTKDTLVARESSDTRGDSVALADAPDGGTSLKDITPRRNNWIKKESDATQRLLDNNLVGERHPTSPPTYDSAAGRSVSSRQAVNTNSVSQNTQDVNNKKQTSNIDTKAYVKSQVTAQKAETKTPIKQKVQDSIDNLKHYLVDDAVAYERYVKDKGDRLNLREGIDRVRTSDTIAKQMIEDSGLSEVIGKMSTASADEFQQYLIAKRSQELKRTKGADFKTGRNDAADQALIQSVGNKYAAEEKVVREFNKKMLDYAVDTGLISKKLRDQLVKDNTDYVPMNRVLDDVTNMGMHKSKQLGNLSKQTAVQKIEGSDRIVQNPLESMIRNAIRTVNEGERNKVAKQLSETAAFREARLPEGAKPKPGNDTLSFVVNGEKVSYEVPALVAKEMKNLNGVMPDFAQNVLKVLGAPTKVLRTGATGANPMFAVSNLVRDQLQTTITGNLKANIKGTPKALKATFGIGAEGKAMQAELARNGIIGSEYRQTYGYKSGELVKELQQSHQLPRQAWEKLKHPIDTIADVIGKTEYFTRAQQYYGTDGTVTEKSQAARNNTLNFGRAGSTVRVLNKVIPFLNAGVQGGRITVNQFKERPVRTTMAVAAFAGIAAAVRGANSAQDQELWDRIGDEEKQSNLIIFGSDAHYDPETNRVVGVTKIPLPQMVYPITDAVNNLKGKSEDLMMLGGDIFTAITGIDANNPVNQLLPTAVKPFVETAMNKNTYSGQEIVSDYDSNLNPEDKGKKYTTGLARNVAKATGIDAPIIDNFIQNWGGGLFKDLTKVMTDNPDNKSDGGGIGEIFSQGAFRRFMSASIESQYDIQATLAEDYKKQLKADPAFQALDANEQKKALDRIDTDTKAVAGFAAKTEQGRADEITNELSKRQKSLMQNGFDVSNYNQPSSSNNSRGIEISDSLGEEHKKTLDQYNSMEKEDWDKYIYTVEGRDAEYKLAAAKLENDKANGKLTEVQELKRRKELQKLKVSQTWDKSVRDAYSLAGSKTDMQGLLDELDNRDDMVGYLNALNRAMYDAGVITASTYKSRNRNINNLESSTAKNSKSKNKTAYSAASKTALSAYAKALASGNNIKVNKSPNAPSTNRKMSALALVTSIKKSNLGAKAKISVKKGIS